MSRHPRFGADERPSTDAEFFAWWSRVNATAAVDLVERARVCGHYGGGPNGEFLTVDEANDYFLARCWQQKQPLYSREAIQPMSGVDIKFFP